MMPIITWLRRRLRRAGRDRGASAIEVAILGGTLVVVSMLIVQFALWFEARHAALAAAQEGDRAAREDFFLNPGQWAQIAGTNAMNYFQSLNTGVLKDVNVQSNPGQNNTVSVTVSGTMSGVWTLRVSETVSGPVECFRTEVSLGEACPG